MDFVEYLKLSAEEIEKSLTSILTKWSQEINHTNKNLLPLSKSFLQASSGGKRLRGTLVKLGFEMAGGVGSSDLFEIAAVLEIFQTAILAHDDVIDRSPIRRGKPTIYQALGANHYAISQAVCLGDVGFFLCFKIIAESDFPSSKKNLAVRYFSKAAYQTVLGQMLDVELPHISGEKIEKDVLAISQLKTAYYSLIGPLSLGVVLFGANSELLDKIIILGERLGVAFQIQDDILGIFGDELSLGKSVTSDIEEGKNTLLITQALNKANSHQRRVLDQFYGQGKINERDFKMIQKVIVETGALEYAQKMAASLVEDAKKVVLEMPISNRNKSLLNQMADFLVNREK